MNSDTTNHNFAGASFPGASTKADLPPSNQERRTLSAGPRDGIYYYYY